MSLNTNNRNEKRNLDWLTNGTGDRNSLEIVKINILNSINLHIFYVGTSSLMDFDQSLICDLNYTCRCLLIPLRKNEFYLGGNELTLEID